MHDAPCFYKRIIRVLLIGILAGFGGYLGFNSTLLAGIPNADIQRFLAGIVLLLFAWRMVDGRKSAWFALFSWHLGAGASIPAIWRAFFGDDAGFAILPIWAAVVSLPALILPKRLAAFSLALASAIAALTPVGIGNPVLASTAHFPGLGWAGLAASVLLLTAPAIRNERLFLTLIVVVSLAGSVLNLRVPSSDGHEIATWITTNEGVHPTDPVEWMSRQIRTMEEASAAILGGFRLVLTPEGTSDRWDYWAKEVWESLRKDAQDRRAMVLVGVYLHVPRSRIGTNGLFDVTSQRLYPATLPMPIGMWKPWDEKEHYPARFDALFWTIPTPAGEAAYVICYEELLIWPLAAKIAAGGKIILAASNQWFVDERTRLAQERSFRLQARLWGYPALRAVNWPKHL